MHVVKQACLSVCVLAACLALWVPAARAGGDPAEVEFSLADGNTMAGFVYGESEAKPLVILVHGASDTHTVFDFAPGYRAARVLAGHGFGVLAVDRVGYGASSRPDGDSLDFARSADYLHEVVQAVRAGALGFVPPAIVLLGPSAGADIVLIEAGTHRDVDGVIVCFQTNQLQPEIFEVDVDAWLSQGPYFDFGVPFRTDFFYARPFAQRRIIDLDNATRSLVPRAEILSALGNESAPFRDDIDVPVLLLQAEHDEIFVPQDDSALFTASPDVSFELLELVGHKGFSHFIGRFTAVHAVRRWLDRRFRGSSYEPATSPGRSS
jgi:pimeloyl-ACP methyl ester carboxylesterase